MGITPIVGIRPITWTRPASAKPDLAGVFAAEFRGQERDESYSSSNQRASRGLEDEDTEESSEAEEEPARAEVVINSDQRSGTTRKISFFA